MDSPERIQSEVVVPDVVIAFGYPDDYTRYNDLRSNQIGLWMKRATQKNVKYLSKC